MAWHWNYLTVDGGDCSPLPDSDAGDFPSQSDAESWLGETWAALLAEGVESVSLYENDRKVYGPMGLRPVG
ncbi:MAG: hypothetical protein WCJ42_05695 [Actinomycetes bacterium]